jgi:2-(1,2-epoxy-1,2-dihydrophenyl)acetyl-CoA isomerase
VTDVEGVGEDLTHRLDDGVLWITINRADAGNALTSPMRDQIPRWMDEASADPFVRAVVLTAAGERHFCTGADLRGVGRVTQARPEGAPDRMVGEAGRIIQRGWQRMVGSILDCEKPVICGVNGTAAGGGMHLALACDLVIMADTARFIEIFIRRGIAPDAGGAYLLARLIGPQRAKELFFFGDDVAAADAERIGLVNRVVPAGELHKTLEEWAGRLAHAPTRAIAFTKWLVNRSLETDRTGAFWDEAHVQELVSGTEDSKEGVASFLERRDAHFKGW